jgi:hypothetical protein
MRCVVSLRHFDCSALALVANVTCTDRRASIQSFMDCREIGGVGVIWRGELSEPILPATVSRWVAFSERRSRSGHFSFNSTSDASNLVAPSVYPIQRQVCHLVRKQHRRVDRSNFERTDDACSSYAAEAVLVTMNVDTVNQQHARARSSSRRQTSFARCRTN